MNYCQFRNETIKRMAQAGGGILPAEYQQVEYIERPNISGDYDPYIATSVPLTNTYWFEVCYKLNGYYEFNLFGSNTTTFPFGTYSVARNRMILSSDRDAIIPKDTSIHTITAYYDSVTTTYRAFLDGTETSYLGDSGNTANNGFTLFRARWGNFEYSTGARIYYARIKDSIDGNTTLDLYPCYRKSDNKPGMYDLVTNTFFTNVGTGEFTVGQDV